MKFYLKTRNGANAVAEYDTDNKRFIVLKNSIVTPKIAHSPTFRGVKSIENTREKYVKNGIVVEDVEFKSPSTAANFITGTSTNGCRVWKDESGVSLKELLGGK